MNRGAVLAKEKLAARGARAALARDLEIDAGRVSRFLNGELKPSTTERAFIEDHYEIGWRLWDEDIDDDAPASEPKPTGDSNGDVKGVA